MKANQARWPIATMARLLRVSTSGYYAWLVREASKQACSDAQLLARIRTVHASSRGTYGAPRVHVQLAREGVHVGRKRVARLMRMAGLSGASRRHWKVTTRQRAGARRGPDLTPMRRRTWRAHRCSPCQLIHPPRWSSHKHLLDHRCCDDRLNPPNTLPLPSAGAVARRAYSRRWGRPATPMTTRCASRSSARWRRNC
jgi:HTH-like domain